MTIYPPSQCFRNVNSTTNNPTIVQIGAHDGTEGEEYGLQNFLESLDSFNLYLIEPLPNYFQELEGVYSKYSGPTKIIHYHNYAISEINGQIRMNDLKGSSHISASGAVLVDSKMWETFVAENQINQIDLLLMDCEGYEFNILKQINFEFVNNIRYEFLHLGNKEETDNLLRNNGFTVDLCESDPTYNKVASRL